MTPGAMKKKNAAAYLDMSVDHFERHVQPHLPCIYSGQLRIYRVKDLDQWLARNLVDRDKQAAA